MMNEHDITELGTRTAHWLAAAHDDPQFMLAGLILRSRPPRRRVTAYGDDETGPAPQDDTAGHRYPRAPA